MFDVVTNNLDIWGSALLTSSTAGRGSNGNQEAYGIKKLRELILELAARGKLVPQDPNDKPASALLESIRKVKSRLVEEEHLVDEKPLPEIAKDDEYFSLPSSWAWTRLGEVTNYGITDKAEPDEVSEDTWVLDLEDVEKGTSKLLRKYRFAERPFRSSKNRFSNGDVIYGKLRPYLDKVLVADEDGVCTTEMMPVRGHVGIAPFYLRLVLKTPHFIKYADDSTHGMNLPRLSTDKARMALFPLAPSAEQHRIVAKVDELMTLCDQLEQQQIHSIEVHHTLVGTLLAALTRATSPQELNEAWTCTANNFDTLFTTEHSIDQLKQTTLQLAAMGKLVSQDRNDEDVRALLARCDGRRRAVAEADRRADAVPQPILSGEDRWEVPETWAWRGLADLVLFVDYRGKTPAKQSSGIRLLTAKNVRRGQIDLSPEEFLSEEDYRAWMTRGFPRVGDVLFTTEAPLGNAAVVHLNERFALAQRVICFQDYGAFDPAFLVLQILSTPFQAILDKNGTGMTAKGIKASKLKQLPVAIPPLAEQRRIVAKVDELMALCDGLKARINDAQATQVHFADAIVEQAVA